ncbi:MAG: FAD synthetase family protein [Bacteroidales bacterium]|jgi:riboflavin kinase/FMN adenylyltransferase|nr:FAD synthetase family protein [Bacteroidales bacterium]
MAVGTFDGVHKAHRIVLNKLSQIAKSINGTSVVISFSSHPRKIINPDFSLNILTTQEEKNILFQEIGIDTVIYIDFTQSMAEMSYIDFIKYLNRKIDINTIVVGYDHNFGKDKEGNISNLKRLTPLFGFEIVEIPQQTIDGIEISSSSIREAIHNRNFKLVKQLLGRNYALETHTVSHTANEMALVPTNKDKILPPNGNYSVEIIDEITQIEIKDNNKIYLNFDNNPISLAKKIHQKITIKFLN